MGQKGILGRTLLVLCASCCFPYVVTLGWTGSISGKSRVLEEIGRDKGVLGEETNRGGLSSGKRVILDRETSSSLDVEEYLVGVVARQIPADYAPEALKAQAIIARTYIYQQMAGADEIAESALDMDYLEQVQMERLWGTKNYLEFYQRVETAVAETKGMTLCREGSILMRCSAGAVQALPAQEGENRPYLRSVECAEDLTADGYLQLKEWTPEEFSRLISGIPDGGPVSADQVPQAVQIAERDSAGYVTLVQIGNVQFTGDEVRYALDLQSPCFRFEDYGGNIRAEVQGIGHGYGFSQYAANEKAKEGWSAEELLLYFYDGVSVTE